MRTFVVASFLAVSVTGVYAQLLPQNDAGVSFGHIHFVVSDPDATKKAWTNVFGATPAKAGSLDMLKLPGTFIIVSKANMPPTGGSNGSSVNHIGIAVKAYADTKAKAAAAGLMWRELTPNVQAFATFPENVTVEVMEVKDQAAPAMFHHVHESVPDPAAAQAWYVKQFGAGAGSRRNLPAAMIPGGEVDFLKAQTPQAGTKGRSLDHIGFDVKDLDATLKRLADDGVTINMPLRDMTKQIGLKIAFITDPNGTYIELTEGLAGK
ncbi:MAG TPA: VOC family protein [Bryobacteraceae bacterium]|jgi:catechol 2,3-dioxygenase-like lactoylglutathione lyase family enzyme|nr:VOC family protein [Bryobacteraceae bacterium]